ncbi:MAG: hypothetical protein ACRCU5_13790 [Rhizobiaceae bacterium]
MSDTESITIIRGHITRFHESVALNNAPASLVGKEVRMTLQNSQQLVQLVELTGIGFTNEAGGTWWWEVTPGNLTSLGDPDQINCYLTIFNSDNSIFMRDALTANVSY